MVPKENLWWPRQLSLLSLFFPELNLSPSICYHLQSVCDTACTTSQPEHFGSGLSSPHSYVARLKRPDLSRGDTCHVLPSVHRGTRRGPASSSTSGTASGSSTPTWAGPMTASSTSTGRPGSTGWRRRLRTARDPTAAPCSCTSPVRDQETSLLIPSGGACGLNVFSFMDSHVPNLLEFISVTVALRLCIFSVGKIQKASKHLELNIHQLAIAGICVGLFCMHTCVGIHGWLCALPQVQWSVYISPLPL